MPKILIINVPGLANKGGMAVVMGAVKCLRESLPDAQITSLCHHQDDFRTLESICLEQGVEVKKHPWLKEHGSKVLSLLHSMIFAFLVLSQCALGRVVDKLRLPYRKNVFQESDVILDLNIDCLHDHYGMLYPVWTLSNIFLGIVAGKPVVVWSSGIGRFDRRATRLLAQLILNRVHTIIAREAVSGEYLKTLGITRPKIEVTADHAFFLEPAPRGRIAEILANEKISKSGNILVGIAPSQLIHRYAFPGTNNREDKYQKCVEVMAKATDYLVDKLNADVILVPHTILSFEDDRIVSKEILQRINNSNRVKLLAGDYRADELKGIIGCCDMFIGCRMHAAIASTSMGVPTIAPIYGQKAQGILGDLMGQGEYLLEVERYDPDKFLHELQNRIDSAWANRNAIREELRKRAVAAKERARLNGSLVRALLE